MQIGTEGRFIITGAAGGIAGAVIDVFADAGARLALVDVNVEPLRERAGVIDGVAIEADLTDPSAVRSMVDRARRSLGGLDGLIHTTGGFAMAKAHQIEMDHYDRLLDLNLRTLVVTAAAVLPGFIEQRQGFVAAFSAAPGWNRGGGAGMSVYAAAKAGVAGFMHAVADESAEHGVSIAIVYPMGVVDTPGNRAGIPDADPARWIDPAEIGRALLFAATRGPRGRISDLPIHPPAG